MPFTFQTDEMRGLFVPFLLSLTRNVSYCGMSVLSILIQGVSYANGAFLSMHTHGVMSNHGRNVFVCYSS